jgi:hypothetical protein
MSDRDEPVVVEEAPSAERLTIPDDMPVLPLRDTVLFPNSFMPLAVAREASVRLIDEASTSGRMIGVFTQREATVEGPFCRRSRPQARSFPSSSLRYRNTPRVALSVRPRYDRGRRHE